MTMENLFLSDFDKITKDVIFKQKLVPNDDESPYEDGDIIPAILDMIDEKNIESGLVIKGMMEFREKKYSLAERTYTIKLDLEHAYVPNSEKIKYQVFIPHTGDEYWFVVWNSQEIHSINLRKYLIQSEGLDKMVEDSLTGGE